MGDYGAKGSAKGYDVKTIADYLQLFNSSWPNLKIEASGSATITRNLTPQTIYTHNLNYPPFYILIGGTFADGVMNVIMPNDSGFGVNNTILGYDGHFNFGDTITFYYYVCRLPLNQDFQAEDISGSTFTTGIDDNYGMKVMKPGADIKSTDLRDYALYSSSRSLQIQQVNNSSSSSSGSYFVSSFNHGLPYIPLGFSFINPSTNTLGYNTDWYYALPPPVGAALADYTIDSTSISMRADKTVYTAAPNFSGVILKDPFYKETTNVSYP